MRFERTLRPCVQSNIYWKHLLKAETPQDDATFLTLLVGKLQDYQVSKVPTLQLKSCTSCPGIPTQDEATGRTWHQQHLRIRPPPISTWSLTTSSDTSWFNGRVLLWWGNHCHYGNTSSYLKHEIIVRRSKSKAFLNTFSGPVFLQPAEHLYKTVKLLLSRSLLLLIAAA